MKHNFRKEARLQDRTFTENQIKEYQIPGERQVVLVKTSNKPDNPDIPIPERYLKPYMEESDYDQAFTGIDRAEVVC